MTALSFIAFGIVFVALICAHFLPAYRAWWVSQGQQPTDIDPDYIRLEDYFARSFRSKVSEWIIMPSHAALPDGTRIIQKGQERLRVSSSANYPAQSQSDEILVVQGAFRCGARSTFHREIYVSEDAFVGEGSRLQAIAVDGNLALGIGVRIVRWVDSTGELEIGANASVAARATAGRIIRLRKGARVGSAFAPTVSTALNEGPDSENIAGPPIPELEIPASDTLLDKAAFLSKTGLDAEKLTLLSPTCWVYDGDLSPSVPIHIRNALIVRGDCILPPGSIVDGDLKAKHLIAIGERSLCKGNVIAEGNILLGPFTRFLGVVHAGKKLQMSHGVRGGNGTTQVAAYAGETLLLAEDVIMHGKVASGDCVTVTT